MQGGRSALGNNAFKPNKSLPSQSHHFASPVKCSPDITTRGGGNLDSVPSMSSSTPLRFNNNGNNGLTPSPNISTTPSMRHQFASRGKG